MKVLIVEDDRATRHLLEQILKARGDEVTACADAESAWNAYKRDEHPLVLIDWMLPGIDGLELCRRLRATSTGAASLILVSTMRDSPRTSGRVAQGSTPGCARTVALPLSRSSISP